MASALDAFISPQVWNDRQNRRRKPETLELGSHLPPIVLIKSAIQPCIVDMVTLLFLVGIVGALLLCLC
jgi:hypothetical protein